MSPSAPDDMRSRWPGGESEASGFLEARGFTLGSDWCWRHPGKSLAGMDGREFDAICYTVLEWDFGGFSPDPDPEPPGRTVAREGTNHEG